MTPITTQAAPPFDAYILDTCKVVATGKFLPGAIVYKGRKKVEVRQWKKKEFDSEKEANEFVIRHFTKEGIAQPKTDADIWRANPLY